MTKESPYLSKMFLRKTLKQKRAAICSTRHLQASCAAYKKLVLLCEKFSSIASYISFGSELNLEEFNQWLLHNKTLFLPALVNNEINFYPVKSEKELIQHPLGFWQPIVQEAFAPTYLPDLILVPGLGFDSQTGGRLGYGKGHYDRLLEKTGSPRYGVGFLEQEVKQLPQEPHDIAMDEIYLF